MWWSMFGAYSPCSLGWASLWPAIWLQDAVLLVLGLAKQPAERDHHLRQGNPSQVLSKQLWSADILLRGWAGGRDVAADVTITDPLQEQISPGRLTRPSLS